MGVFNNIVGGLVISTLGVGVGCVGLATLIDAWRSHRNRHDDLVVRERSRKIALWLHDASYWFGRNDGDVKLVLQEIAAAMEKGEGLFDVSTVREECRAAVKAAAGTKDAPYATTPSPA